MNIEGTMHIFHAVNSVEDDEATPGVERLPAEFLQSVDIASLPPSKLCLKIGAPVILLRNLSPRQGLAMELESQSHNLVDHVLEELYQEVNLMANFDSYPVSDLLLLRVIFLFS
jgi:hypothetical protein